MEKIDKFFDEHFKYVQERPWLAGILIIIIASIVLIGVIKDADWVLEGGHGSWNFAFISNAFGRTAARILVGILASIIILFGVVISIYY